MSFKGALTKEVQWADINKFTIKFGLVGIGFLIMTAFVILYIVKSSNTPTTDEDAKKIVATFNLV